jgi:3-hydroxyisobutyrate dehydrogenase-like beta-hydroxyacid dehydrogenase
MKEILRMFEHIGFIGLGMMGIRMSKRLIDAGHKVVGYDIDPDALERAKANGAETARTPGEVGERCNPVITIVPNSEIVEKVVLGPDGVVQGAGDGDVLIDMTTACPVSTLKVARELEKRGIRMLDAPVSGGVVGAEKGTLSIMVGGEFELFEQCRPLFEAMGKKLFYMGAIGSGDTMKAVNNFLSGCSVAATSEALALATKAGLNPKKVVDVLQVSTGRNYATEWKFPKFVLPRKFDDGFSIELLNKDLDILTRLARELGVPMFIAHTVQQIFNFAISQGYGAKGHTAIALLIEEWAGVKIEG